MRLMTLVIFSCLAQTTFADLVVTPLPVPGRDVAAPSEVRVRDVNSNAMATPMAAPAAEPSAKGEGPLAALGLNDAGFAVGVGYTPYREKNIETASIRTVGGKKVVTIDKENNGAAGIWLQAHYWLWTKTSNRTQPNGWTSSHDMGFGPFIGIQAASSGSSDAIGAIAFGLMWGAKPRAAVTSTKNQPYLLSDTKTGATQIASAPTETKQEQKATPGFALALGVANVKVQTLGEGLSAGASAPDGVSEIYYKTKRIYVPLLMGSFVF